MRSASAPRRRRRGAGPRSGPLEVGLPLVEAAGLPGRAAAWGDHAEVADPFDHGLPLDLDPGRLVRGVPQPAPQPAAGGERHGQRPEDADERVRAGSTGRVVRVRGPNQVADGRAAARGAGRVGARRGRCAPSGRVAVAVRAAGGGVGRRGRRCRGSSGRASRAGRRCSGCRTGWARTAASRCPSKKSSGQACASDARTV